MGIREFFLDPGRHRLGHFGSDRRGRLIIEVNHATALCDLSRMPRHTPRNRSTSPSLVSGPKLTRMKPSAISCGTFIAASTWLAFILPEEQALPAETAIPARSN